MLPYNQEESLDLNLHVNSDTFWIWWQNLGCTRYVETLAAWLVKVLILCFISDVNFDEYDKSNDTHDYKFVRWLTKEKVLASILQWFCSSKITLNKPTFVL